MPDFLDTEATQTGFGALVGTSQQAISKHVYSGLLEIGKSYREWLITYCDKLREEAAGRGGEDQATLTRARTAEAQASAELKRIQIEKSAGLLVPVEGIEPLLMAMVTAARTELLSLPDKLANEIKALHGADVDPAMIEEHIHESLAHLAGSLPELLAQNDAAGDESVGAAAEIDDDTMGE